MIETILDTREIFHGRVFDVVSHEVMLPDGNTSRRDVVQHHGAVALIAIDEEKNVLLVRQYRLPADEITLEIPAGTLNPNEAPHDCAARELQEETGYFPQNLEYIGGIFPAPGYTSEYIHLFIANDLTSSRRPLDDDEFIEIERLPLAEALDLIENGTIRDAKTIVGLLRVARRMSI